MQNPKTNELFDTFAEELLAERNARPLIIVGASKIDHLSSTERRMKYPG